MCIYIYMEYPTSIRYQMGYMWIINHVLLQVGPAHPSMAQELIPNQAAHLSIHNLREQSRKGPPKIPGQGLAVATWILDDCLRAFTHVFFQLGILNMIICFTVLHMYYKLNFYQCDYQNKIISVFIVIFIL